MKSLVPLVVIISIALLVSCSKDSVEGAFENMRQQACNSDKEGFFEYIDKQAVKENFKKDTVDNFTQGSGEAKLSERSQGMSRSYKDEIVPEHMKVLWAKYNEWLGKGQLSPLCNMSIFRTNGNSVTVKIPGHPDSIWSFQKTDGKWRVVSIL